MVLASTVIACIGVLSKYKYGYFICKPSYQVTWTTDIVPLPTYCARMYVGVWELRLRFFEFRGFSRSSIFHGSLKASTVVRKRIYIVL